MCYYDIIMFSQTRCRSKARTSAVGITTSIVVIISITSIISIIRMISIASLISITSIISTISITNLKRDVRQDAEARRLLWIITYSITQRNSSSYYIT